MSTLFVLLTYFITIACLQDFQIRLTHSSINRLVQYTIPSITEHVESQKIEPQVISTVMDLHIGTISIRSFTLNITLDFDEKNQIIITTIHDLSLNFWPFRFTATKKWTDSLGLTCNTIITPTFSNWNFAFAIQPSVDDKCMLCWILSMTCYYQTRWN